ncbi:hypothetical protein I317_02888 [Kwoniella heveanensis CBS 569]|nr:hypothetical protein I317_02888 [Kwoniella heveanensis CBS 569]
MRASVDAPNVSVASVVLLLPGQQFEGTLLDRLARLNRLICALAVIVGAFTLEEETAHVMGTDKGKLASGAQYAGFQRWGASGFKLIAKSEPVELRFGSSRPEWSCRGGTGYLRVIRAVEEW